MEIKADDILRAEIIFKQIQLIGLEQAEAIKKLQQVNQELRAENEKLKKEKAFEPDPEVWLQVLEENKQLKLENENLKAKTAAKTETIIVDTITPIDTTMIPKR